VQNASASRGKTPNAEAENDNVTADGQDNRIKQQSAWAETQPHTDTTQKNARRAMFFRKRRNTCRSAERPD